MDISEIAEMPVGRELNYLVAIHVMGWEKLTWDLSYPGSLHNRSIYPGEEYFADDEGNGFRDPLYFSTDIRVAWEIVKRIQRDYVVIVSADHDLYSCKICKQMPGGYNELIIEQIYDNAPEVICKAALILTRVKGYVV